MVDHNLGGIVIAATLRFHYQNLARELIDEGHLHKWITALPSSKIPFEYHRFVCSRPLSLALTLLSTRLPTSSLRSHLVYFGNLVFDLECLFLIFSLKPKVLIGLSHNISISGRLSQKLGSLYISDVPIAHPRTSNAIMASEFRRRGCEFAPISSAQVAMEEAAFAFADHLVCPSSFVRTSLEDNSVPSSKITVLPYGSSSPLSLMGRDCQSISPMRQLPLVDDSFHILFVGQVSLRKGVPYLLDAFRLFSHPKKKLTLAGAIQPEMKHLLRNAGDLDKVSIEGVCNREKLDHLFRSATIFVLPSLLEGLALVVGEAISYGLPVVFTYETGASDLLQDGVDGVMVKSRSVLSLLNAFEKLAADNRFTNSLGAAALIKSLSLGGWNSYGSSWRKLLDLLTSA